MTLIAANGLLLQSIHQSWYTEAASPDHSGKSSLADYNMVFLSKNIILNSFLYSRVP